jgi:hypothetical protein
VNGQVKSSQFHSFAGFGRFLDSGREYQMSRRLKQARRHGGFHAGRIKVQPAGQLEMAGGKYAAPLEKTPLISAELHVVITK